MVENLTRLLTKAIFNLAKEIANCKLQCVFKRPQRLAERIENVKTRSTDDGKPLLCDTKMLTEFHFL
ncbi:MAG TPA: hypothetical protein DCP69_01730 [Candidatus Omnitrophica bacterium]|nr:hypothetical protein [Candidatus Omnitrophota bacterium]